MNERERWVVYPLLFLALGASLRDKFFQQVKTEELECGRLVAESIECKGAMVCQGVVMLDPANPNQRLIELGAVEPGANVPGRPSTRYGVLILRDSNGRELCGVSNNELFVRRINCEGLSVVEPDTQTPRVLAALGSAAAPPVEPGGAPQWFGVLALNNQQFGRLVGVPPVNRPAGPGADAPPQNAPDADGQQAPKED